MFGREVGVCEVGRRIEDRGIHRRMRQLVRRLKDQESGTEMMVSFHSSGSTSHQWRKLNNPGRTPFRPRLDSHLMKGCFAQLDQGAGPTCISSLAEEASDRSDFLPSFDQDLLSLYGQYRSTLVSHMDVDQAHSLEPERSLFHFHLPSSYLSLVCSHLSRSEVNSESRSAWSDSVGIENQTLFLEQFGSPFYIALISCYDG